MCLPCLMCIFFTICFGCCGPVLFLTYQQLLTILTRYCHLKRSKQHRLYKRLTSHISPQRHLSQTTRHPQFLTVPEACPNPTIQCHVPKNAVLPVFFVKNGRQFPGWFFVYTRRLVRIREILVGIQEATLWVQRFDGSMLGPWEKKPTSVGLKPKPQWVIWCFFVGKPWGYSFTGNKNKGFPVNTRFFLQIEMVIHNEVLILRMGNGYCNGTEFRPGFFPENFVPFRFTLFCCCKKCDSLWSQLF